MKEIVERIIVKLTGGRFILTVIGGATFFYCAVQQIIDSQATAAILVAIFTSYFQRADRKQNGEKPNEKV